MAKLTLETLGLRHYIRGATYEVRDALKGAGCKWDVDEHAWWGSDRTALEWLVRDLSARQIPIWQQRRMAKFRRVPSTR